MPAPQTIGRHPTASHRALAMVGHLLVVPSAWIGLGMGAFLLPLAWWVLMRRRSPLVDYHARFSLNASLSFSFLAAVAAGLAKAFPDGALLFHFLMGGLAIFWCFMILRRATRAWRGRDLRQPRFSWVG